MAAKASRRRIRPLSFVVRWVLPVGLIILGVVFILLGHGHISDISDQPSGSVFTSIPTDKDSVYSALGVTAIIIALMIILVAFLLGMNKGDTEDRQREEAARDYFSRTGRWPGERAASARPGERESSGT